MGAEFWRKTSTPGELTGFRLMGGGGAICGCCITGIPPGRSVPGAARMAQGGLLRPQAGSDPGVPGGNCAPDAENTSPDALDPPKAQEASL